MTDLTHILSRCTHGIAMRRDPNLGYVIVELPDPASNDPAVEDDELLWDPRRIQVLPARFASRETRVAAAAPTIPQAIDKFASLLPKEHP